MRKTLVNTARLLLAVTFVLSGFVKAVDPLGTQYKIADYLGAMQLEQYAPDFATLGASVLLSAVEFVLGICLLFAIRRRLVSALVLMVMLVMTPLTLWLAVANPVSDCGCFGDALVLTNWQTFGKNVVLLTAAAIVRWKPMDMVRFVSKSNQWIVTNYTILFIVSVSGWSLYDLPYFDFRPYHVGTDLRHGWLDMMEGKESPYADFFVERADNGDDITEELMREDGYAFLLVAPYLEQADDSQLDRINELAEYADDHGYTFICLTASNQKGIDYWRDTTGAEYGFCLTDGTVLKTIIRSNPGLVLMKNGVIIGKWSHNRLPVVDEQDKERPLEQLDFGHRSDDSVPQKILFIVLWYVLPLTVLTIADRLWAWSQWVKKKEKKNKVYQLFKRKNNNEKENRSRQLENEPEPARGCGLGQGTECSTEG